MRKKKSYSISPIKIYNFFVGNKRTHIEWEDVCWVRRFTPITPKKIRDHLKHDLCIGSYPIYYKDDKEYCKWICIDVDSHKRIPEKIKKEIMEKYPDKWRVAYSRLKKEYKKKIDYETKKLQRDFCSKIVLNQEKYLLTDKNSVILEDSGGGFHIWILLDDYTLLLDAGKYMETIKEEICELYSKMVPEQELPEFYPKQYKTDHLDKDCGNGVRIPFGKNIGKNYITEILYGNIDKLEKVNIKSIADNYKGPDVTRTCKIVCRREVLEEFEEQEVDRQLEFWLFYPRIRPCFKRIMNGITQCYNEHGHKMRMAMVHELQYAGVPEHLIPLCFENQLDYNPETTKVQVFSLLKKGDWRWSCLKIRKLGYCHECKKNMERFEGYEPKIRYKNYRGRLFQNSGRVFEQDTE